jgi:hypothetical protein
MDLDGVPLSSGPEADPRRFALSDGEQPAFTRSHGRGNVFALGDGLEREVAEALWTVKEVSGCAQGLRVVIKAYRRK